MSDRAPYSRVYWSVIDDPKFVEIYDDDRRLATWLRLLLIADQAHPASPHVPLGVHRPSLKALVSCGLIDLGAGNRYRVHGLDKERARRQTGPKKDPNGTDTGPKPPLARAIDETSNSKEETSIARGRTGSQERPAPALSANGQRIYDRMEARRIDWYRRGGTWDPEWGPKPEDVPA